MCFETLPHLSQGSRHRNFVNEGSPPYNGGSPPYTKQEFLPLARWKSEIYSRLESGSLKMEVYKKSRGPRWHSG